MHLSVMMEANLPPLKSAVRFTSGAKIRCKSAASTSQSANTAFFARAAKDATMLVLPVPPLPLMTTTSFIEFSRSIVPGHILRDASCAATTIG